MDYGTLFKKGKDILKSVEAPKDKTEQNLDAKSVFVDTKKSLEDLKVSVLAQKDSKKKQEQEKSVSHYIDRLLGFSVLSSQDKQFLDSLKSDIVAHKSLDEKQFEQLITVVSSLEGKSESFSDVDKEKVKELHTTLKQQKDLLHTFKDGISVVTPTLDEAKTKAFETIKKDLEKHRWSSWMAQPVYDYLMDKHVHKKSVSKFKEFLIGTVGLTVVGWFVGDELKKIISNIDKLSVDDLLKNQAVEGTLEKVKEEVKEFTDKEVEYGKEKFRGRVSHFVKKNTGKELTPAQLDLVVKKLNLKEEMKSSTGELRDFFKYFVDHDPKAGDANLFDGVLSTVSAPFVFSAKIIQVLKEENIVTYQEVGFNIVGNVVEYGFKGFQMFGHGLGWVMGRIPLNEVSSKMGYLYDKTPDTAKMILFSLMYKSTNSFVFRAVSNTAAFVSKMALWPLLEAGDDIKSMSLLMDGYKGNMDETLKQIEKISDVLPPSGQDFVGKFSATFKATQTELDNLNKANKILHSIKNGPNFVADFKNAYRLKYGFDVPASILKGMESGSDALISSKSEAFKIVGNKIKGSVSPLKDLLADQKMSDKVKNFFGGKISLFDDSVKSLDNVVNSYGEVVRNNSSILKKSLVGGLKSRFNMIKAGLNFSEVADRNVFSFGSVDDMNKFMDYTKSIAKSTPEALKFLIGKSPIFLIGGMSFAGNEEFSEKMKKFGTNLLGLVPFIGPFMIARDGAYANNTDWSQVALGGALIVSDLVFLIRDTNKIGFGKALFNSFAKPIIDVKEIIQAGYKSGATIVKWSKGLTTVIKAEGLVGFGKSFFSKIFTLGKAARLGIFASLMYAGYCGYDYIMDNVEDKEVQDLVTKYKDDKQGLNNYLREQWPSYDEETKCSILSYSAGLQLNISPDSISDIDVDYNAKDKSYNIKMPMVYNRDELLQTKSNLQQTLQIVEPGSSFSFALTGTAQVDFEKSLKEQGYSGDEIKKQYSALGYQI